MRADLLSSSVLLFGTICLLDDALPAKYNLQFGGTWSPEYAAMKVVSVYDKTSRKKIK